MLDRCEAFLVYLHANTWASHADESHTRFVNEITAAMDAGMQLVLAHETAGLGQECRHGCEFEHFFADNADGRGATPQKLLQRGIYNSIAVPLKGSSWRRVSIALLAQRIVRPQDLITSIKLSLSRRSTKSAKSQQKGSWETSAPLGNNDRHLLLRSARKRRSGIMMRQLLNRVRDRASQRAVVGVDVELEERMKAQRCSDISIASIKSCKC